MYSINMIDLQSSEYDEMKLLVKAAACSAEQSQAGR